MPSADDDPAVEVLAELVSHDHPTTHRPVGWYPEGGTPVRIYTEADSLCIDRTIARRRKLLKVPLNLERDTWRAFEIPHDDIVGIAIEGLTPEHARGWRWTTGWMGSGQRIPGTTGVLITTNRGWVLLRHRIPTLQVKGLWAPLLVDGPD